MDQEVKIPEFPSGRIITQNEFFLNILSDKKTIKKHEKPINTPFSLQLFWTLVPVIAMALLFGCESKSPSEKILQTFESKYPEAKNLAWKDYEGNWQADYKMEGQTYTTLFDHDGSWIQTKHQIDYGNAPKVVRDTFGARYDIDDITEVFEVQMQRKSYYEFTMHTQNGDYRVTYDAAGNFLEKDRA